MPRKSRSLSGRSVSKAATPTFASVQRNATVEFNPDYTHIKRDLKRIGILSASLFAVLIALSFFLR